MEMASFLAARLRNKPLVEKEEGTLYSWTSIAKNLDHILRNVAQVSIENPKLELIDTKS